MKRLTIIVAIIFTAMCLKVYAQKVRTRTPNTEIIFWYQCPLWSNQCQMTMYGNVIGVETYYPFQAEMMADYLNHNAYAIEQEFLTH